MVRVFILASVSLAVAGPAIAGDQQVRRGPVPSWARASELRPVPDAPSGPIFVRRQDLETHLTDKGTAQYVGYRVKLLQPSALEAGNIAVTWNPAAGAPVVHGIKLYRDGQAVDVLKNVSFEVLRREQQLETAQLDGMLTAVLRVPDLRVGDELEVELTTFVSDPTLGRNDAGLLALLPSPSPGRYHLGLSWDAARAPLLKVSPDLAAAMTKGANAVDFRFDDPAPLSPPKDAPPRFGWRRVVQYSDFPDWASLSRHFAPLYAKAATPGPGSALKAEAARIATAHRDPLDRAAAALKLVQQNVRYVYVGLNGGNYTPASADETWRRRYGDCKGKTALLLALLAELGIDAEPVLLNANGADDGLEQRLPIPQLFDHVLVRARVAGKAYWLDGTLPSVAGPAARPVYPVRWVLPLKASGAGLEPVEWRPAAVPDEINMIEIDARAGFDQPARIVSTAVVRGIKGLQQQVQFSAASPAQLLDAFRQNALGDTWQKIDDVNWRYDERAAASILTISGTGSVDWDEDGNGGRSLALPGGGFSPPERRVRAGDQEDAPFYSAPEYSCYVTTVRLPGSTQAKQWSSKPSFDTRIFGRRYHRAWELRDGSIRMVRGSRVEQPEIDMATAQRDNARIPKFDNSMGWISYDPSGRQASVGAGERVPATFDFDWTSDDAPCLPPAKAD